MSGLPIPHSLLPDSAESRDGVLFIGGCNTVELAQQFGTPLFVYDAPHIRSRAQEAVRNFPDGVAYASKAFLTRAIAKLVSDEGMNIDVSTGGELHVALAAGVSPDRIVLHGNNKSADELRRAIDVGVHHIVVDSFDEIDRIESLTAELGTTARVLVRVTPGVEAHTHEYVQTGQEDSKFGFGLHNGQAQDAIDRLRKINAVSLHGIHVHIGSQIFATDSFAKAINVVGKFVNDNELTELCVGGGLGVGYIEGEDAPTITEWATITRDACKLAGLAANVRITAEPGRAIIASSAITFYTVGTIKHIPNIRTYVAVDGGMSDNPRPILYGSGYETFLPRDVDAPRPTTARVVGKHCESGDVIVNEANLPHDMAVGDILATPVTGAYGLSMASNYNNVPRPAAVLVNNGNARVILRRETFDDILNRDQI